MPHIAESLHWYTLDGEPAYTVKGKDGNDRSTTLRDARKLNLVPSVTFIIKCAAVPGLELWKAEQLMLAALTLPRLHDESESMWLDRVKRDSREQARKAAERGTAIHASLQGHFEGIPPIADHLPYTRGVSKNIDETFRNRKWIVEKSFASKLGFGGKCDLAAEDVIIDFKTKEFTSDKLPQVYDEHIMQLAAYREGLEFPHASCAIVFVSVTVPGLSHICILDETDLTRGWKCFCGLLQFWQAKTGHRPCRPLLKG